jgi:hypothetical protein
MEVGDLIGVDGSRSFDHGCLDYAVLRYLGDGKAEVVEAQSCHSCWQVGHDSDHVFTSVGDVWPVGENEVRPARDDWARGVTWEK